MAVCLIGHSSCVYCLLFSLDDCHTCLSLICALGCGGSPPIRPVKLTIGLVVSPGPLAKVEQSFHLVAYRSSISFNSHLVANQLARLTLPFWPFLSTPKSCFPPTSWPPSLWTDLTVSDWVSCGVRNKAYSRLEQVLQIHTRPYGLS